MRSLETFLTNALSLIDNNNNNINNNNDNDNNNNNNNEIINSFLGNDNNGLLYAKSSLSSLLLSSLSPVDSDNNNNNNSKNKNNNNKEKENSCIIIARKHASLPIGWTANLKSSQMVVQTAILQQQHQTNCYYNNNNNNSFTKGGFVLFVTKFSFYCVVVFVSFINVFSILHSTPNVPIWLLLLLSSTSLLLLLLPESRSFYLGSLLFWIFCNRCFHWLSDLVVVVVLPVLQQQLQQEQQQLFQQQQLQQPMYELIMKNCFEFVWFGNHFSFLGGFVVVKDAVVVFVADVWKYLLFLCVAMVNKYY